MFNKNKPENRPGLEKAIDDALLELSKTQSGTPEYKAILEEIEKLYALRLPEPEAAKPVSKDALVAGAVNLAGIILIINHEKLHVISTKALGFVGKFK
ncbi:hypothetical protein SEA_SLOOPYJOE_31 [Arthrobacter phage Sloopyjoe]|nr:hypothetical protein PBI_STAYER_31 [Arthrobacter phage Stayer]QFG10175.1 hypothetical protein PBI_EGAD_31 [Arthrobacter phage Egad]QFG11745.1 hypothetical protein PBI_SALK_31 [Arthrobacter phage Salk]QFG12628.1 hypothetical protein PBI_MICHELLE_31 [Arthrobacter phage Michelle]QFG14401.1 hypothetical protein PBI_STARLORD_31 [Arthrobacter phage StarLord]UVT31109.1 hypothetical protein PBI_LINDA_31 [Arthrobacter phage Linda]WAB09447.1 hypothetical protein SEA_SLOOPYJOE_31 [Arthrobacter phage 